VTGRVPYAEVGAAMRATLLKANGAGLTVRQHRTLGAVLALTGTYSRLTDRVWLAELAAFAHGVELAEPWMLEHVGKDLVALESAGVPIVRHSPRGRPPTGSSGPAYLVGIHPAESRPDSRPDSERESRPDLDGNPATPMVESRPDLSPPTEKTPEKAPEKNDAPPSSDALPGFDDTTKRPAKAGRRDPARVAAERIVKDWWERQDPKPQQPWVAVVKVIAKALRAGWTEPELRQALEEVPTISGAALDLWRNRRNGTGPGRQQPTAEGALRVLRRVADAGS
jgi:hypothetical protein